MRVYFLRHGQTDWNVEGIRQGWTNNPINKKGVQQAKAAAQIVKDLKIEHFYCSDLLRAKMTAEIVNKKLNMDIVFDGRLREFCSGDLQGEKRSEIPKDVEQDFRKYPHKFNAESVKDVFNRANSFVTELTDKKLDNVLVITHGGIMQVFRYCEKFSSMNKDKTRDEFYAEHGLEIENTQILEMDFTNRI